MLELENPTVPTVNCSRAGLTSVKHLYFTCNLNLSGLSSSCLASSLCRQTKHLEPPSLPALVLFLLALHGWVQFPWFLTTHFARGVLFQDLFGDFSRERRCSQSINTHSLTFHIGLLQCKYLMLII